ncbi:hypothetical protein Moror_12754 [Moniliophthora roreri MCA 2997]|uniref:DUF6593 domain-containing protein n=2 Tax=Moniliophthora roreri TaxID=221103 RepID=V2XNY5_MONRO|nr:hypothetical protein Moror_12754 [Moniliophthora roreri MCA 2997]KAI3617996.1 hypothetical protein WG66_005502 [Moniliophthora roreri]
MDLLLSKDSVRNCTITLLTGQPVYQVSTPSRFFHTETTTIKRFKGNQVHDMAVIERHDFHDDVCQVWGRDIVPKSDGCFSSGRSFTASDSQKYTWKMKCDRAVLRDQFDNTIAAFEKSHTGFFSGNPSQAKISISQAGLSIADELIATFVLVEQKDRESRKANGADAAGAAASAAAG